MLAETGLLDGRNATSRAAHHRAARRPVRGRIAEVYLLKWHDEGQLSYAALVRRNPHADAVVRRCEEWLARQLRERNAVAQVLAVSALPARTLKRRFKAATGATLIGRLQDLRVEQAKQLLEEPAQPVDEISAAVGYEDASFFRRVFRQRTGLQPSRYRLMFRGAANGVAAPYIAEPVGQVDHHTPTPGAHASTAPR